MIPKFRAWHKELKKMAFISGIFWNHKNEAIYNVSCYGFNNEAPKIPWPIEMSENKITLMQWTGFQSTDGVDLYVGDIVETLDGDILSRGVIFYQEKYKEVRCNWLGTDCDWSMFQTLYPDYDSRKPCVIKVIGNIYQNPELLEDLN